MKTKPFRDLLMKVSVATWRTTICRLIRAEQQLEAKEFFSMSEKDDVFEAGRQHGQEQVLRLIARWGKCRPLEGMGGADMAEALRKVLTPTIPYTDYKGITQAVTDGDYNWRPAGNGLEERVVTRTTMQLRSTPK
jgi:hypothetical protein